MRSRFLLLAAVVTVASSLSCPAESEERAIRSYTDQKGRRIGWFVSSAMFLRTPEWKFDGKTPPPLDWTTAYAKAHEWLKQNRKKFDSFALRECAFQRSGFSDAPDRWYYLLEFTGILDGEEVFASNLNVMILMDGTVVEPREEK